MEGCQVKPQVNRRSEQMRKLRAEGMSNKSLAKKFKMSPAAVSQVINRKTYRHVK